MSFFIVLFLFIAFNYVSGECDDGCNIPTALYEELNCKPTFASPTDCCPSTYDCSHVSERIKEDKCYFRGKTFDIGSPVPNEEIYGNCEIDCSCNKKSSGRIGFDCSILDCPEVSGDELEVGCSYQYELNKCCSKGQLCPPFNVTCELDGKTYHEGEQIEIQSVRCMECICKEGFAGKLEAPFCRKRQCIEEVIRHPEVHTFCAPSYLSLQDCCPFNWICPKDDDNIALTTKGTANSDLKCKFGKTTFDIGDAFEKSDGAKGHLSCECRIPPYLTCIQNYEYPAYAPDIY